MAVSFRRTVGRSPHIEMMPLIDVVFQLLVFFMLTSVFASPAVELTLPQLKGEAPETEPGLMLHLDGEGVLFLDEQRVAEAELGPVLREALAGREDKSVYFRGDRQAPYEKVLHLMRTSTEAGAARFHFVYEEPQ